jgi:hypothetical protein
MTVVGERLIHELRGISCISLETLPAAQKGCAVTRMFSSRVESLTVMAQAIASHATRLGGKLRRQALGTDYVDLLSHQRAWSRRWASSIRRSHSARPAPPPICGRMEGSPPGSRSATSERA